MVDKLCRFYYSSPMETTNDNDYRRGFAIGSGEALDHIHDDFPCPTSLEQALAGIRSPEWQLGWSDGWDRVLSHPDFNR